MDVKKHPAPVKKLSAWRARMALIGIFTLFFVPVLSALWLNVYAPDWQPFGVINRGDLVVPAVRVEAIVLTALDGRPLAADYLTDRWTLVYVATGECEAMCENALLRMRQVRLALGKERDRVQRLIIETGDRGQAWPDIEKLREQFPGLRIASVSTGSAFSSMARDDAGAVLLIDPQSFWMMRFSAALPAGDMLKDMQRLLKLSKRD